MKLAIGSQNPAKIKAVETVILQLEMDVSVIPMDAPSSVSEMPFSDEETMKGAIHRAEYCLKREDVQLAIGLEGGVMESSNGLFLCNWGALAEKDQETIVAGGARMKLPQEIAEKLREGETLGAIMAQLTGNSNVHRQEGAIGVFTNGLIKRDEMFSHIIRLLFGQWEYRSIKFHREGR